MQEVLDQYQETHPPLADGDNAALLYRKAFSLFPADAGDRLNSKDNPVAAAKRFLEENREFLATLQVASRRPGCEFGYDFAAGLAGIHGGNEPQLGANFADMSRADRDAAIVKLLSAKFENKSEDGKIVAILDLLNLVAERAAAAGLGREALELAACQLRISRQPLFGGIHLDQWRQQINEEKASRRMWAALEACNLQERDLVFALDELRQHLASREELRKVLQAERAWQLATIRFCVDRLGGPKAADSRSLAARDGELLEKQMDYVIELAGKPLWKVPVSKVEEEILYANDKTPLWRIWTRLLYVNPGLDEDGDARAALSAVMLGIGCRLFLAKEGHYPQSLEELSAKLPERFPSLPVDPFSGNAFGYARTGNGCKIWSIGRDRKDDQGNTKEEGEFVISPGGVASFPLDMVFEFRP